MRVFELAKKLKLTSKDLLRDLKKMGIKAQNHMTSLPASDVQRVLGHLKKKSPESESAPVKKKTRVLIKRKAVTPPSEEKTDVLAKDEKEEKKIEAPEIIGEPVSDRAQTPAAAPPVATPTQEAVSPGQPQSLKAVPGPLGREKPQEGVGKGIDEKEKRKLLKTNLFELAKQELSNRYKERYKKVRKAKRSKEQRWMDYRSDLSGGDTGREM